MSRLIVVRRGGDAQEIKSESGRSIMEIIRHAGIDEMMAICGGSLCCATCHIYIDPAFSHRMPAMSQEEDDLLSQADHRTDCSRLACQIPFHAGLDGLRVQIAG